MLAYSIRAYRKEIKEKDTYLLLKGNNFHLNKSSIGNYQSPGSKEQTVSTYLAGTSYYLNGDKICLYPQRLRMGIVTK